MKHWFKDEHFRSLLKNSSYLALSKAVAAVAGVATLAFAGRGLGVVLFGTLILITSYAKAASGLSKFQSWQLIVRYGGKALVNGDQEDFKASTGFAFALDVVSGIGGMILAVTCCCRSSASWFGIPDQYLWLAMLYCTLLPTMGAATPVGVLRALDRFDLISWQGSSYPDRPRHPGRHRLRHGRAVRSLCRHLVRHRSRRRPVPVVPRLARAAPPRHARRHPPDAATRRRSRARGGSPSMST